jgi:phosphoglycerate dehydrogenase-like enzyme
MWAGVTPLMEADLRQDYILTGVKGVFGPVMAEYVICHLLMHERRSLDRFQNQLKRQWDKTPPGTLQGKRIGIMGLGSIGLAIAGAARFFGMHTRGYSRSRSRCEEIDQCFLPGQLVAFVQGLDYLVCVLPDTPETRGLIDATVLGAMAETAVIINVGRGNVVDEPALVHALERGDIAGAVLDVFHEEPLPLAHPLWVTPNTIITSHTAAVSFPELIAPIFIDNYHRFVTEKSLNHRIDFNQGY